MIDRKRMKRLTLAFPWPESHEAAGPAVRLVIRDPLWLAIVRRTIKGWCVANQLHMPTVGYDSLDQLPVEGHLGLSLEIVEVGQENLLPVADWMQARFERTTVALLARNGFGSVESLQSATCLLQEAGASSVVSEPLPAAQLTEGLDRLRCQSQQMAANPVSQLPLRCWGPAWQAEPRPLGLR